MSTLAPPPPPSFREQLLAGASFARRDLRRADFSGADLSGADLSNCDLRDATFEAANVAGAKLRGANLTGATILDCDLAGADLSLCTAERLTITGCNLRGARLVRMRIADSNWTGINLADAMLIESNWERCRWQGLVLTRAIVAGSRFVKCAWEAVEALLADLSRSAMTESTISGSMIDRGSFVESTWKNVRTQQLSAEFSDWQKAVIEDCAFPSARWTGSRFRSARAVRTNFEHGDFFLCDIDGFVHEKCAEEHVTWPTDREPTYGIKGLAIPNIPDRPLWRSALPDAERKRIADTD